MSYKDPARGRAYYAAYRASPAGRLKRSTYAKTPARKFYEKTRNATPARREARAMRAKTVAGKQTHKRSAAKWFASPLGRATNLKRLYGITVEQWEALFNKQGRVCAICKTPNPGNKWWNTDHHHTTRKVRGVLCHKCNAGIGLLQDSPDVLQNGVFYLLGMPT